LRLPGPPAGWGAILPIVVEHGKGAMRADLDTLLPALRARRDETRENRKVLPEVRDMIRDSGVARLLQPPAYGGAGGPLRDIVGAVSDVGAACGSTGWAVVQYVVHPFMVAQWPREAQDEVWGDDPKNLVAGILIQSLGRYERVDGGYRVSGRWPFVTGVDTCDWCIVSGYEEGRVGQHESHLHFLIERGEIEILDTWNALGLRGSGTNDVRLREFFVPAHRGLSMEALRGGESPGGHWRETPFYMLPSYPIFGCGISSGAVGIALEMVAEYNEIARKKGSIMAEKGVATFASQHIRFAESKAAVDCARQLLSFAADEIGAIACEEGRVPTLEERARCRALATYAGNIAMDASRAIWGLSGAASVYSNSSLGNLFTDMLVANQHFTQNKDVNFTTYGRMLYGLDIDNPTL
jgi:3-hydroxy-9,10-secoandrosta-1,3,5(10)-triene-9,17-dione monooxygenase